MSSTVEHTPERRPDQAPEKRTRTSPYMVAARLFERWTPGATVFAMILTVIVMIAALIFTDAGPRDVVDSWGGGLASLLAFMGQIALALLFGHMLTHTRPVRRVLSTVFDLPRTAVQAYAMVFLASVALTMLQWAIGLVAGAILARGVAASGARRGLKVDFPLLVAAAYSSFVVAGMAYNGTIPLTSASSGSFVDEQLGHTVPLTETVFTSYNIVALVLVVVLITVTLIAIRPRTEGEIQPFDTAVLDPVPDPVEPSNETPADWIETRWYLNRVIGLLLVGYLVSHFWANGFDLSLDIVNWSMLAGILLLVGSPRELAILVRGATSAVGDVLLQFPLYAGIIGMATGTGLIDVLSDAFIAISTPVTLPLFSFLSACIVNMAVPSAGGQFAVQGPIMLQAGETMGVDPALMIMSISYGDSLTNMIQPFFALPVLAIAGISVRSVFKYTFAIFVVTGLVCLGALTVWSMVVA